MPAARFARSGDVYIAFAQHGVGPDLVFVPAATSTMGLLWGAGLVQGIARDARVTWYDKRGLGQSDGAANFTFEERMDDVRAIMDAAEIDSAHFAGVSEGGPMSILFAATYPERVQSLTLYGTYPSARRRPDYPEGWDMGEFGQYVDRVVAARLGDPEALRWQAEQFFPSKANDEEFLTAFAAGMSSSPTAVRLVWENMYEVDVRSILTTIQVPTTIVHRVGDRVAPLAGGRYLAEHISGAKLVEVPGDDHGDLLCPVEVDRRLATVLFTDIVDSTPAAERSGDRAWSGLLDKHDSAAAAIITSHQGILV
jgi:pimeloyl-ACP methyl ester carboxylesterase